MARRKRKTPRGKKAPATRIPLWKGAAPLLAVDQAPFLRAAVTRCKRTIAKVNRCRREIEAFEAEDRPAYEAWTAREFGPLLTKLRETGQALGEKASLADHLQWALHAKGVPVEEVYEYVMRHRADPEYRHPVYDAEDDTVDTEGEPDGFADDTEESDEEAFFRRLFEDFFDERFGGEDDDEDEDEDEWERIAHRRKTPSAPPPEKASELKKLFRRLARRLHPDGEGATALAREQWEEAHAAYRRGDVEALRTLDTVSEVEGVPVSAKLGLARLEAIRLHNERRFRGLSAERRDLKEEPAWGFSRKKPTQIKALHSDTKGELFVNLDRMEDQLEAAEAFIYDLKRCGIEEDEALRREREEDLARRTAYEAERARRATARKANGRTRKAAEAAAPGQREFVFS